jgi:hypothetical protein
MEEGFVVLFDLLGHLNILCRKRFSVLFDSLRVVCGALSVLARQHATTCAVLSVPLALHFRAWCKAFVAHSMSLLLICGNLHTHSRMWPLITLV